MSHTVVGKLNKAARQHQNDHGVVFFVDIGERVYNRKAGQTEYTNYSAALFAKDAQVQFYNEILVEGSVIEVSGTGLLIEMPDDPQYKPRLSIQDAKLGFFSATQQQAPQQNHAPQQNAPQVQPGTRQQASQYANQTGQHMQGSPQKQHSSAGQQQGQQGGGFDNFEDVPF